MTAIVENGFIWMVRVPYLELLFQAVLLAKNLYRSRTLLVARLQIEQRDHSPSWFA